MSIMNTATEVQPATVAADIGWRIECHDPTNGLCYNRSFGRERADGMGTYGADLLHGSWRQTLDSHLSWEKVATPFLSFFASQERAMAWRDHLIRRDASDIVMIAVWLRGKTVYDASAIARALGYQVHSPDKRRRLEHHDGELLLHGGLSSDEYRILLCAQTDSSLQQTALLSPFVMNPSQAFHTQVPRYTVRV